MKIFYNFFYDELNESKTKSLMQNNKLYNQDISNIRIQWFLLGRMRVSYCVLQFPSGYLSNILVLGLKSDLQNSFTDWKYGEMK